MEIDINFSGELADRHQLPGLTGTMSIEGLARSMTLVGHYAVTGRVKHRYPFSPDFTLNLVALEQGSFRAKFVFNASAAAVALWLGEAAIQGMVGNFATDLFKNVFNSSIGATAQPETPALGELLRRRPGDLDALREATLPSMRQAHSVINRGAESIIINGDHNQLVVFDRASKEFLENIDARELPEIKIVSVGMLNVNTKHGRVFDYELGRMVSIFIPKHRSDRVLGNLAASLSKYAKNKEASQVYIKYYVRTDKAGNPEKYLVVDAWFEGEAPPAN